MDLATLRRYLDNPRVILAAAALVGASAIGVGITTMDDTGRGVVTDLAAPADLGATGAQEQVTGSVLDPAGTTDPSEDVADADADMDAKASTSRGATTTKVAKPGAPTATTSSPNATPAGFINQPAFDLANSPLPPSGSITPLPSESTNTTGSTGSTSGSTGNSGSTGQSAEVRRQPAASQEPAPSGSGDEPCIVGGTSASEMPQCDPSGGNHGGSNAPSGGSSEEGGSDPISEVIATVEEILPVDGASEQLPVDPIAEADTVVAAVQDEVPVSEADTQLEPVVAEVEDLPAPTEADAVVVDVVEQAPIVEAVEQAPIVEEPVVQEPLAEVPVVQAPMFEEPEAAPAPAPAPASALPAVSVPSTPMF